MSDVAPPIPIQSDDQRKQQILDYINQTLSDYGKLQPNQVQQMDMSGQPRAAQLSAISGLGSLAGSSDLDAESNNALAGQLDEMNQGFNQQRQGAQQNLASRGLGAMGGGAGFGAGLQATQQFASPAAAAASQQAAASRQRALGALQQYAQMGGQVRQGDFGSGQMAFQNQLSQIQGMAGARNQLGNYYSNLQNQQRAGTQQGVQAGLSGAGLAIGAAGLMMSDENTKDIQGSGTPELEEFLHASSGSKYKYDDAHRDSPMAGRGTYVTPMAQELRKSKLGKDLVEPLPDGTLAVNYPRALGTVLSTLSYLNDKIDNGK